MKKIKIWLVLCSILVLGIVCAFRIYKVNEGYRCSTEIYGKNQAIDLYDTEVRVIDYDFISKEELIEKYGQNDMLKDIIETDCIDEINVLEVKLNIKENTHQILKKIMYDYTIVLDNYSTGVSQFSYVMYIHYSSCYRKNTDRKKRYNINNTGYPPPFFLDDGISCQHLGLSPDAEAAKQQIILS